MNNNFKESSLFSLVFLSLFVVFGSHSLGHIFLEKENKINVSNKLIVSAAASLKDAIEEVALLHQQQYPETEIIYNFASSGSLQRQIELGAPVDVFISAATTTMDILAKQNLLRVETRANLLENQIVLIVPQDNKNQKAKLNNFTDLTAKKITTIALGEPQSVPVGKYAQEVLNYYQITNKVNPKAVYGKDARQVLNYVATGNVEAGIVYRTDAENSDRVRIVAIAPENTHSPVIYPVAAVKDSDNLPASQELIQFLNTPAVREIFAKYGFKGTSNQ